MEAIELGIDSLPDFLEDHIEDKLASASAKGGKESDPDLPGESCFEFDVPKQEALGCV